MHPFLSNRSSVLLYIVLWILIGAASSFSSHRNGNPDFLYGICRSWGIVVEHMVIVRSIGIRMMRPSMLIGCRVVSSAFIAALWLAGFLCLDAVVRRSAPSRFILLPIPTIGFTGGILTLLVFAIHLLLLSAQEQRYTAGRVNSIEGVRARSRVACAPFFK